MQTCQWASACFVALAALGFAAGAAVAADKPEKVLRHVVLYKFRDTISDAQVKEVVDAFSALPSKIDTIIGFEAGENVSQEGKSEGLTHAFVVTFRDEEGLQTYLKHPAHLKYVELVRDRREKVVVFDYWTQSRP